MVKLTHHHDCSALSKMSLEILRGSFFDFKTIWQIEKTNASLEFDLRVVITKPDICIC